MPKGRSSFHNQRDDLSSPTPLPRSVNISATFPPKFKPFLTERTYWKVVYGGRGSAKTESCAKALLLMGKQQPLRILCCREIMQSIKQSSHNVLSAMVGELGLEEYYTVEKQSIYGPFLDWTDARGVRKKRRTEFLFAGLREMTVSQIKSYHDIQICWIDEAQDITSRSMQVLTPTIRRAGGSDPNAPCEIWLAWNPTRESDWVFQSFVAGEPLEDSTVIQMNWRDNPWFEQSGLYKQMDEMRRRQYDMYLHVWEGECIKYWQGQVYLNELKEADEEGRLCDVPYRSDLPCYVAMDIGGKNDATAIWIWQPTPDGMIHLIDYHEAVQSTVDYHLKWIESKPYVIDKYYLPHDAQQRHAGMQHSYEQLVRAKGKKVQIVPAGAGSVEEGINAVRTLFPRMKFDARRCARGLSAIRNYRFEIIDDDGTFSSTPVKDKYAHGSDSLRYACMAYRIGRETKVDLSKYHSNAPRSGSDWMTL